VKTVFYWETITVYLLIFSVFSHQTSDVISLSRAKVVAPPSDENENSLVQLKGQYLSIKVKTALISTDKPWHNTYSKYVHLERTARRTKSVTDEKNNKHHIFAPTTGARCSISQTLHGGRGRRDHSNRWQSFFDPAHTVVFPTGCTEKCGENDRRAVSLQWLRNLRSESCQILNTYAW